MPAGMLCPLEHLHPGHLPCCPVLPLGPPVSAFPGVWSSCIPPLPPWGISVLHREVNSHTCTSNRHIPNSPGVKSLKQVTHSQIPGAQLISLNCAPDMAAKWVFSSIPWKILETVSKPFDHSMGPHGVHPSSTVHFLLCLVG